jgi:hypothetical protein
MWVFKVVNIGFIVQSKNGIIFTRLTENLIKTRFLKFMFSLPNG